MIKKIKDKLYFLKKWYQAVFSYPQEKITPLGSYDSYWESRRGDVGKLNSWQKERAEIISKIIGTAEVSVLDIGCGDGGLLNYLVSLIKTTKAVGADSSPSALALAKKFGIETKEIIIDNKKSIETLPSSDLVLLLEVLEHLPNAEEILNASYLISKKGLFFSFPNSGYFLFRLRLLFGKFPMQWRVHPGEHLRFWTLADLKWWLKAQGFSDYEINSYKGMPFLNKLFPSLFAAGFLIYLPKNNG